MALSRRELVWRRAKGRCEYCQMPQIFDVRPFQIDHVRAQKHRGATKLENLALACLPCNAFKGTNLAGYDPLLNKLQRLFNPRLDNWNNHFDWAEDGLLIGKSAIGRTTIEVLRINDDERIAQRVHLFNAGLFAFLSEE